MPSLTWVERLGKRQQDLQKELRDKYETEAQPPIKQPIFQNDKFTSLFPELREVDKTQHPEVSPEMAFKPYADTSPFRINPFKQTTFRPLPFKRTTSPTGLPPVAPMGLVGQETKEPDVSSYEPLVATVMNVRTGEVIPQEELGVRYPKGYEGELDEWVLSPETAKRLPAVFKVFGQALSRVPKQTAVATLQAVQGLGGASVVDRDWADRFIRDAKTNQEKFVAEVGDKYSKSGLPVKITDIASLPQNIGYSITSMGAGLGVGVPIGLAPVPGARIAAWTAGTAASGAVAYRMTTYQIMQEYLEAKNDEKIARTGTGLTQQEENTLKIGFESKARQYGLWEAVPEAISNLAFGKILTAPLGKMVGKTIAKRVVGKLAGMYGEELLTETITQKGQSAIEVEAGLRGGKITWWEAFKEVAPQTFLLTTVLGGVGQVSVSSYNRIKESLKNEVGENKSLHETIKEGLKTIINDETGGISLPRSTPEKKVTPESVQAGRAGMAELKKEPWRMTREEFVTKGLKAAESEKLNVAAGIKVNLPMIRTQLENQHRQLVNDAVKYEGKPVPPEVLADYPDLQVTPKPEVTPEVGMPEAGIQQAAFGVPDKVVRPEAKGRTTQADMADYLKLQEYQKGIAPAFNEQQIALKKAEVKKLIAQPGKLPKGTGTKEELRLELARLEAQEEIALNLQRTKDTTLLSSRINQTIEGIENELGQRTIPYHGGAKATYLTGWTSKQLEEMITVYRGYLATLEPTPTAPVAQIKPPEVAGEGIAQAKPPVPEVVAEAPPPPGDSVRRVYDRIQFEEPGRSFNQKMSQGWHTFNVKMVDDLFGIKKIVDQLQKGGVELSIDENPYLMARLLKGIVGKANVFLEEGTFGKQFWKMEKGKAVPNFTGESIENILKEVKKPEVWRDFSTYLVAKRALDLNFRGIKTGISQEEAAAAINDLVEQYPNFDELAERVYAYQDRLMVYGREMGLFSDALLGRLRKYGNYVPFYRVFNELQAKGMMGQKMANIAQPVKKIKGSEREIINPLESIIKNTYVIISAADHNQIGIQLANLVDKNPALSEVFERVKTPIARVAGVTAKELGIEAEGLTDKDAESIVDIFRPSFFLKGDEVTVLIDGKKHFYKVDPDLRAALLNLNRESLGMLGKIFGAPARWLRAGATLSPDFMVRNPARDQMTAFVYSNYGFLPGIDFLRGTAEFLGKGKDYQLYRASGAEHAMMVSMDRSYLQKSFKELVEGRKFSFYVKHPIELLRIGSELGEKATRLGEFKAGIRRGALPLEAGYSSRAVSLDFAQAGTTAHAINQLIAFFNANLRGWGRMASSFKEHPVRTSFKVFLGITLPSILLYMANRDDPRWKEIPQWQKDLFWIVMTEDNIYRIPKPFELGIIFGSVPERFLEYLDNKDPEMLSDVMVNLAEAGSPGFIPTAGLPILEWMTNYSFFRGRALVPASRQKMPPSLQYTEWSSEVSKELGELLNLSPAKLDNLFNGYTAGLGRYALDILDGILKGTGISPDIPEPSPTLADRPVIKAFVVRTPYGSSGETVDRFYGTLEKYEQGEKYLKEMMNKGEESKFAKYKAAHPELFFFYDSSRKDFYSSSARFLRKISGQLSEIGKEQREVYGSAFITPSEKRRLIDSMDILKTTLAREALDFISGKESLLIPQLNEGEETTETPTGKRELPYKTPTTGYRELPFKQGEK